MAGTGIDETTLQSYLSDELGVDVVGTEVIHDGLNLSVAISTPAAEPAYVLRRPNKLRHTEAFNDVRAEYGVLEGLRDTSIPAPRPVLLCDDESILGDPFLVTTYLDGETIPMGSVLPRRFQHPIARERVATSLIDTMAALHSVDEAPFRNDCERHTPAEQVALDVDRLEQATNVTGLDVPRLWEIADWLREHAPSDTETAVVHGDYRPANVLFAGEDEPAMTGVLDWETAFLGDPRTELGYFLLRWRDDGDPVPDIDEIATRHPNEEAIEELRETNERGLAPFTNEPGSPTRRELVTRYEEQTGTDFENERFYRALGAFVLAAVWADLDRHAIEHGEESTRGPYVAYMAMLAERIVDGGLGR